MSAQLSRRAVKSMGREAARADALIAGETPALPGDEVELVEAPNPSNGL
ncbi:MAG TPA: hypothetical protein VGJ66_19125 [Pyrinomonadaceae bacterium]